MVQGPKDCRKYFIEYTQEGSSVTQFGTLGEKRSLFCSDLFRRRFSFRLERWGPTDRPPIFAPSRIVYLFWNGDGGGLPHWALFSGVERYGVEGLYIWPFLESGEVEPSSVTQWGPSRL